MTKKHRSKELELDNEDAAVPFTARLNAYFRAEESRQTTPLLVDPFAETLVGDMSEYFMEHKRVAGMGGSAIVRSYYIESELLTPWCSDNKKSQIVLLGAGLDTRAYRFKPVQRGSHTIIELDLPLIIRYKEKLLYGKEPLCSLIRIPTDLSDPTWVSTLIDSGFSTEIPTFWVMEGLAYYIDQEDIILLLRNLSEMSTSNSQLFVDVCVPALADLRWGPYTQHFKWGISKDEVSSFFASTGWKVSSSFIDDHCHGRDVGQKGIIFVHGQQNIGRIKDSVAHSIKASPQLSETEIQTLSVNLTKMMIPEIERIIRVYPKNRKEGLSAYLDFVKRTESDLRTIAGGQKNSVLLGHISPRLLGDPLAIEEDANQRTPEEIESFIIEYLKAILYLTYCGAKGLQGDQFQETSLYAESLRVRGVSGIESIHHILEIMKRELNEFDE
jgi:methyltransferase (TIGR00027 family)